MRIEMTVNCPNIEDADCPTDCPLYKLSERMATDTLTRFPQDYAKPVKGLIDALATRLEVTDAEIENAKANCAIQAQERADHPEILN